MTGVSQATASDRRAPITQRNVHPRSVQSSSAAHCCNGAHPPVQLGCLLLAPELLQSVGLVVPAGQGVGVVGAKDPLAGVGHVPVLDQCFVPAIQPAKADGDLAAADQRVGMVGTEHPLALPRPYS